MQGDPNGYQNPAHVDRLPRWATESSGPTEIRQILIYPPGKGGIAINMEDYMCLAEDQYLNDVIIDFYLQYLKNEVLTDSQKEKTHIFSMFFYKRLTTKPRNVNKSLTPAQKRHLGVKTWTKNVNIFDKDFIVVPINQDHHERRSSRQIGNTTITPLAKRKKVTFSFASGNLSERDVADAKERDLDMQCDSDEEDADAAAAAAAEKKVEPPQVSKTEPIKQPCILIFDSLAGESRSESVVATLRDYCRRNAIS